MSRERDENSIEVNEDMFGDESELESLSSDELIALIKKERKIISKFKTAFPIMLRENERLNEENMRLRESETKALINEAYDPETKLLKPQFCLRKITSMEHAAGRRKFSYGVFFIDIDRIKVANDITNQPFVDRYVINKIAAESIGESVRQGEDMAYRIHGQHGDEFAIFADLNSPNVNEAMLVWMENRIRANFRGRKQDIVEYIDKNWKKIKKEFFLTANKEDVLNIMNRVDISIGVSVKGKGERFNHVIIRAENACKIEKQSKKNMGLKSEGYTDMR